MRDDEVKRWNAQRVALESQIKGFCKMLLNHSGGAELVRLPFEYEGQDYEVLMQPFDRKEQNKNGA